MVQRSTAEQRSTSWRSCMLAIVSGLSVSAGPLAAADADPWPGIRKELYADRAISEAAAPFQLYAPAQAADAALVPVDVRLPAPIVARTKALTIVIDRNPAPVAARIEFGAAFREGGDIGERVIETRMRVDNFSKVRAILELTDGQLVMVSRFVAGAGGCSSPASKDPDEALTELGRSKILLSKSDNHGPAWREGRVMIRHPNFTGMQMNARSGQFTPARYVDKLVVKSGARELMRVEGGISISENPYLRFTYGAAAEERLSIVAKDTAGSVIEGSSEPGGS